MGWEVWAVLVAVAVGWVCRMIRDAQHQEAVEERLTYIGNRLADIRQGVDEVNERARSVERDAARMVALAESYISATRGQGWRH